MVSIIATRLNRSDAEARLWDVGRHRLALGVVVAGVHDTADVMVSAAKEAAS